MDSEPSTCQIEPDVDPDSLALSEPSFVVGIGASAGGLEAIEQFFDNMPAKTGLGFVLVQHLSPDFKSLMSELLARHTQMKIHAVEDGMDIRANEIYLIPPRKNMVLSGRKLRLTDQKKDGGLNLPIDLFFESLAEDMGDNAIAVVLSGTGSDGSRGIQKIHESGGLVLVQSSATAGFDGMPKSAQATGKVDVVSSPEVMPGKILQFINHPQAFQRGFNDEDLPQLGDDEMQTLFRLFRRQHGVDFTLYRPTTINRRIERRRQMSKCATLTEYLKKIDSEPAELDLLYRDLLVEVTEFFRDTEAFRRLETDVIPELLRRCNPTDQLRFWVPGCATGEEAYSLAMLAHYCRSQMEDRREVDIKIFATDVHQRSLETASSGVYSTETAATMPARFREMYLSRSQDLVHIIPALRQMVIFAPHDITRDPPFTKIDLISCRNALIYLRPPVQKKVLSLFHFGLKVGGTLFLGPSETLGDLSNEFDVVDSQWRIYTKRRDVRLHSTDTSRFAQPLQRVVSADPGVVSMATRHEGHRVIPDVHEALLQDYVPPSFLVNQHHELVHCFGDARRFLQQPEGRVSLEILNLVEGELRMAISAALHRARSSDETIMMKGVTIPGAADEPRVRVVVKPYTKSSEPMYLICLEPEQEPPPVEAEATPIDPNDQSVERIVSLERELAYNKETLQSTVEELETSNEELQSTNEELVASNEELQSTNEELHSVNEELHTVNSEYQRKIEELTELSNDMDNLLLSTQIGTIFLDCDLNIRKFTPAVAKAFYVLPQDIGRPIQHIASNLDLDNLKDDALRVIETGQSIEREARNREGTGFLMRIQPYRDKQNTVQGVVLTFVDISAILARAEDIRRAAESIDLTDNDLQEFAYAVSHDFGAPLRHIASNIRLLRDEFFSSADLGDEAQECMTDISSSVARMEKMLIGLLKYSRVYTRGKPMRKMGLDDALDAAQDRLQELIAGDEMEIDAEPLPEIIGDPEQMTFVFQELFGNAIKYARELPPRMWIRCQAVDNHWQIDVQDNGIGIAPQHRDRIFVIFERLEFRAASGDGIGLSIVQRILQRHGASISVHRDGKEKGSLFRILLPQIKHK